MKTKPLASTLLMVGVFSATQFTFVPTLRAGLKTNQPALSVLGKPNFSNVAADGPTATEVSQVEGVAIDPVTNKLFVADDGNHRILRFGTVSAYRTGAAAEAVFGQADFVSGNANRGGATAANTFNSPRGICVDAAGRLWVADYNNARVLRFDNASTKASGSNADAVLGQANFVTDASAITQSGMSSPTGVTTDRAGNLFVVDRTSNRILIFYNAAGKGNGANADRVLGQADFVSSASATTASTLNGPWGVSADTGGRLWVGDAVNSRVLRFDNVATIGNGAAASAVFGQLDFVTSAAQPLSAGALDRPYYVTAAPDGTLWVGDYNHERILGFKNAAGKPNGGIADIVLGQPDFLTEGAAAPSASAIDGANAIAVDKEGGLFVSDYSYHRIMRFSGPVKIRTAGKVTAVGGRAILRGTSEHASRVRFKVPGQPFANAKGLAAWRVKLKDLTRSTTRVRVQAITFDNRRSTRIVKVLNP